MSAFYPERITRFYAARIQDAPHLPLEAEEVSRRAAAQDSPEAHILSAVCWLMAQQPQWTLSWWTRDADAIELVARLADDTFVFEVWLEQGVLHSMPAIQGVWWPHAAVSAPVHQLFATQHMRLATCVRDLSSALDRATPRPGRLQIGGHVDDAAQTLDPINPGDAAKLRSLRSHKTHNPG